MPDQLIIPDGFKAGCNPRVSRYGEWFTKLEDAITILPDSDILELIRLNTGLDRDNHVKHIFNQANAGSCAAEAGNQRLAIVRAWQNQPFVRFNPYATYHFTSGGRDNGSTIDENGRYLRDVGALPESVWPRSKGWRAKPPQDLLDKVAVNYRIDEQYDVQSVQEIRTALVRNFAVQFGWDAHSCVFLFLIDLWHAFFVNSWNITWGDRGCGVLDLREVDFRYGAVATRSAVVSEGAPPGVAV